METWSKEATKHFWDQNQSSFAGDRTAPVLYRLIRKHISGRVLEVGCGSGALLDILPATAVGLDLSPGRPRVIAGDATDLPFRAEQFDTIIASEVLEHLSPDDAIRAVCQAWRVLAPFGKLIITVPNRETLAQGNVTCPQCGVAFHRWGHQQSFDADQLKDALDIFYRVRITALPLGLMADSRPIELLWRPLLRFRLCRPSTLLAVAVK